MNKIIDLYNNLNLPFHRRGHKLDTNDFYTELNVRGYDYGVNFRNIQEVEYDTLDKSYARVKLENAVNGANWITFAESLIQLYITHTTTRGVYVALSLPSLKCDPNILFSNTTKDKINSMVVMTDSRRKCVVSKGLTNSFHNLP